MFGDILIGLARWIVLSIALILYLYQVASPLLLAIGILFVGLGIGAGYIVKRLDLSRGYALIAGILFSGGGWLLSQWLRMTQLGITPDFQLFLSEAVMIATVSGGLVFMLRVLADRFWPFAIVEFGIVVLAFVQAFEGHRFLHIDRPMWLGDWAILHGYNPILILGIIGIIAGVLGVIVLIRDYDPWKAVLSLILLLLLGALTYNLFQEKMQNARPVASHRRAGQKKHKGKGKGGGGGKGPPPHDPQNMGWNANNSHRKQIPIAVAVLHDEYDPPDGIYYFREKVFSKFNGVRLVEDISGKYDQDVVTYIPPTGVVKAKGDIPSTNMHRDIPVSVYLIKMLSSPIGLESAIQYQNGENPNPKMFVSAYQTISRVFVGNYRLLFNYTCKGKGWSDEKLRHYLQIPNDPRYKELLDKILAPLPEKARKNDFARVITIINWLEDNGVYSLHVHYPKSKDPVAEFLFGPMKGYCVHFANAAAYLLRTAGIPARVAIGFGLMESRHSKSGVLLITSDRAHSWVDVYFDGLGWIPFNVMPKKSEEPPLPQMDKRLEKMFGQMVRKNFLPKKYQEYKPMKELKIPWKEIFHVLGWILLGLLIGSYMIKWLRRLLALVGRGRWGARWVYLATLDMLADAGNRRGFGQTHEAFSEEMGLDSLKGLTYEYLGVVLGRKQPDLDKMRKLYKNVKIEFYQRYQDNKWKKVLIRILVIVNPGGWWFSR